MSASGKSNLAFHSPSHRIAEEARQRLRSSPPLHRRDLSCDCEEGVLWLHGQLPSFYEKQIAQEAVKSVEGVAGVINDIEVTG